MGKEEIISYVMETPGNTNPNVLRSLLDNEMDNRFIVTLTLTSETGGITDKSNKEMYEAALSGKTILFDIDFFGILCRVQATLAAKFNDLQYPSFNAYGIDTSGTNMINIYVDPSDEESYTFTIDTVEIGGGSSGSGNMMIVTLDGNNIPDKSFSEMTSHYLNGGLLFLTNISKSYFVFLSHTGAYITGERVFITMVYGQQSYEVLRKEKYQMMSTSDHFSISHTDYTITAAT